MKIAAVLKLIESDGWVHTPAPEDRIDSTDIRRSQA
jgi:hypothetical protein